MILSAMFILPIGSYLVCYLLSKFIQVDLTGASFVENRNDEFIFHVNLSNTSLLFANNASILVKVSNSLFKTEQSHIINVAVNPFVTTTVTYPCKSEHSGVVTISIEKICLYDMFHCFCVTKNFGIYKEIPILPNYSIIPEDFSMDFTAGYNELAESTQKGSDSSEVSDIREYIPGDRLQDIHWKLSAKKDALMVKDHVSLSSSQLVLYVELINDFSLLDSILDSAYGIGNHLCLHNIPFTLLWYSLRKQMCCKSLITSTEQLKETIIEILFESPLEDVDEIAKIIPATSGFTQYITIGADYVTTKKEDTSK